MRYTITLGTHDAKGDWGYAPEYMEAAWLMLRQPAPDVYVVATGKAHSAREFLDEAFGDLDWQRYTSKPTPRIYVRQKSISFLEAYPHQKGKIV